LKSTVIANRRPKCRATLAEIDSPDGSLDAIQPEKERREPSVTPRKFKGAHFVTTISLCRAKGAT
jgi:hypothetical protein